MVLILVTVGSLALASLRSREAQVNQSLALAAQSRLALQADNLDLALALAIEAIRIPDPPGEVQVALSEAAYTPGTVKVYLGHSAPVRSVAVSPDGRYGLSGDDQGVIFLWDLETGEALRRLEGHQGPVSGLAFTPDGRRALSSSHDKAILYWDLEMGEVIHRLEGHRASINSVAVSPDGRTAASSSGTSLWTEPFSSEDNTVRLWDLLNGAEVQRFDFFTDGVTGVDFTADGRGLAVSTLSDGFLLLEVETGKAVVHRSPEINYLLQAQAVKTSPDGKFALTSNAFDPINNQYKILIWDIRTAEVSQLGEHNGKITGLDIRPDGKRALSSSIGIVEYDLESREQVNRFNIGANSVAYLPDGRSALAGSEDGSLRLLALASGAEIGRLPAGIDFIRGAAYDPAGQAVITDDSALLSRWDLETGEKIWSETFSGVFGEIALSADGRRILASDGVATASLWDGASGELLGRLESDGSFVGHDSNGLVTSVALHPSGQFGLSGAEGQGTNLIYWDLESGSPVWLFDTNNLDILGVAVSPDGRTALSADSEGAVSWWDLETGELLRRLEGHTNRAWSVAFVDQHTAISASEDSTMILWNLESGTAIHNFLGHAAGIIRVALSPDKRLALSASRDRTAILWDVQTGEALRRYAGHTGHLMAVAWAPDGREAISGGADYQVIRWRIDAELDTLLEWIAGNRYLRPLTCDERATYKVEPLCPEGRLAEAGEPGSATIPVTVSGAALLPPLPIPTPLPTDSSPALARVEEAGRAALGVNPGSFPTGGGEVWEYGGESGERLSVRVAAEEPADMIGDPERQRQNGLLDPTLAIYSPDGSLLAQADDLENGLATDAYLESITLPQSGIYHIEVRSFRGQTGGDYRLVLAEPRPLVFKAKVPGMAGLAIHPNGERALVGMGYSIFWDSPPAEDQRIWVWDLRTGEVLRRLEGHTNTPADIAISPDGRRAISAGPEGLAILWDLESGAELLRIDNQGEVFVDVQFHPDGRTALTASTDTTLALWDLASGEVIRRFEGHEDWVNDLALSSDGKTVYSTSWDNTVRVWNVGTGELLATYRPFEDGYTNGLAASPDGEYLLVGRDWYPYDPTLGYDGVMALLDADTGETLRSLEGHTAMVGALAFSPDGRYALSGSRDQTVRLWEANTGEQLKVFYGHAGEAWNVAFSPDGLTGYSTGSDGSLRVWDLREFVGARE
ncbi:MAG TPA: WD40 repeat domain-containing protein [Anaerolineales bacterium]|nr:WD40 repeat domain-containing protein [Anaerolineales bacterium]